ncbi:MAG: hypothetical protein ACYS7Y_19100 [Planctomycetota bacterium]|jgi:hypothetical protein
MANELVPFKLNTLPAVPEEQLKALDEVAKGADFLPRIQLVTKGKYVDTGKIPPGRWGVPQAGGEEIENLGEKIDVIPLGFRPKAVDMSDKDAVVTVYDTKDPEFARIKNTPKGKDGMSGCMWGPSFIVLERSTGQLYELFFCNASGRNEAGKLKPFLPTAANGGALKPASLGIRYIKKPEYGWHVPVITKCSEPFDPAAIRVTPEQMEKEIEKFLNPEKGAEKVSEEEASAQKRAR